MRKASQVKYRDSHFNWQLFREPVYPKKLETAAGDSVFSLFLYVEATSPPSCLLLPPGAKSLHQALAKDALLKVAQLSVCGSQTMK